MIQFTLQEKWLFKYCTLTMGLALAGVLAISATGCSSMPLYRHVQLVEETKVNLDLIAGAIANKINDGTIPKERAERITAIYNKVAEAQHLYVKAVKAFRKGTLAGGETDLDARFSELSLIATDLAAELMVYGIDIYKFIERIK